MNKLQIICPVVAILVVGLVLGVFAVRGQHRGFVSVASHSIGDDLVRMTNSTHLVRVSPELHTSLSELLVARARVADVLPGDEPSPRGDGLACSRLLLTNELGHGLLIRLGRADKSGMFQVLGWRPGQ